MTSDECREAYIASRRAGWRTAKHPAQWKTALTTYVTPIFGAIPVAAVDTGTDDAGNRRMDKSPGGSVSA
jgi:hypothetical protein